ncbi:MAG: hypothetical protein GXX96_01545 [Planctomycetaceae bacterium]|nr:hypothetical protein [Planctomycetaceae bacterium]
MSTVQGFRFPQQRTKKATTARSSRVEALEPRRVLAAPTLADLPSEINIYAGAPVHLALGGADADGDSLTYTVSSTNPQISASIPKQEAPNGNRSMRITVQGYGQMVFELFEGRAPETTSRIIEIAESDWYDDRIFHRVIDGFMIQGGSRDGLGINGTGTQFDDEYDVELQFTSSGLLAMAKAGDDTNDSQFFITDVPSGGYSYPRWLDFNHTIFGKLTSGDNVREAISAAATNSSDRPTTDIVIESVEIFQDTQNAVMMIAAPHGTYDTGNITVTVSDGKGGTASKTVQVNVLPDGNNNNPFLGPIDPIRLAIDQPYSFQLNATDVEGDKIYYQAELLTDTDDITVEVSESGLVTITPKNEVVGVAEIAFRVGPTAASLVPDEYGDYEEATIDAQIVTIEIPPAKPVISFAPGADTGVLDGNTSKDNSSGKELFFEVKNLQATSELAIYLQGVQVGYEQIARIPQGDGTSNFVATIRLRSEMVLDDGNYTLHIQQLLPLDSELYGDQKLASDVSEPLEFSVDTAPPVITSEAVDVAFQGEEYFYDVDSDDEGDDDVYYELQIPFPAGMTIDSATGEIRWTPAATAGFTEEVVVRVTDGAGNKGEQSFEITVYAPLEISLEEGDTSVDELQTVTLILEASNPADSASSLVITLQDGVLPAEAYTLEQLDGNRARFTWTTGEADGPGVYDLVFGANDGADARGSETIRITVSEVNQAPEFTEVFDEWTGAEEERIDLQFVASDGDLPANELLFNLFGEVPDGAVIDETSGLLSWTPDEIDGGRTFEFGVRVTDSGGLSDEHTIVITVVENQKAPVFDPTPPQRVTEGEVLDFVVAAHDPDVPAHALEYQLEGDVPAGLTIDAQTGRIRWDVPEGYLPGTTLEGTLELTVVAREVVAATEVGQIARQTVEITVVDGLADLVAATLTLAETAISDPLAGPTTVSLTALTLDRGSEVPTVSQKAEFYDDRGFFGTLFGPIGTGGGIEPGTKEKSDSEGETDPGANGEGEQTSALERLLDEIAGDVSTSVFDALLYAKTVPADAREEPPVPADESQPVPLPTEEAAPPAEASGAGQTQSAAETELASEKPEKPEKAPQGETVNS